LSENVFYYRVVEDYATMTAAQVSVLFHGNIGTSMLGLMSVQWNYRTVAVINGMDNDEFDITLFDMNGSLGGNPLPPFVMVSTRSPWNGPGTRRGRHYFPFGSAGSVDINGELDGALELGIPLFAWVLGQPLSAVSTDLVPVTLSGGFKLGVVPVVSEEVSGIWEWSHRFSSIDSRRSDPLWLPGEEPPP
jgi:hypothetical protein